MSASSADGREITVRPPPGWQAREIANGLVLRSESGNRILLQVYDRGDRDLAVRDRHRRRNQRVMRLPRR